VKDNGTPRTGRPPTTSSADIATVALELFLEQGYEATTLSEIARRAGIGRSTLFRHVDSKGDIVWHGREAAEATFRESLSAADVGPEWRSEVVRCLVASLRFPDDDLHVVRLRMALIDATPALRAHLHVTSRPTVALLADFIARSTGSPGGALEPEVLASTAWWVAIEALFWWARGDGDSPEAVVRRALAVAGFADRAHRPPGETSPVS